MLIEVVQSAVFGALTTGRIKPHEVIVIEGDRIGTLAGKLSGLRYLVEQELIEDEPTSDEEESEEVVEREIEEVEEPVEEEAQPEVIEPAKAESKPEERAYKYEKLSEARNPDGTPVLSILKANNLIDSGMTAMEIADKYSIRSAQSISTAVRNYKRRYHKEPDTTAILMAAPRLSAKHKEDKDEDS